MGQNVQEMPPASQLKIHVQLQRTAWNVAFHVKQIVGQINMKSV